MQGAFFVRRDDQYHAAYHAEHHAEHHAAYHAQYLVSSMPFACNSSYNAASDRPTTFK